MNPTCELRRIGAALVVIALLTQGDASVRASSSADGLQRKRDLRSDELLPPPSKKRAFRPPSVLPAGDFVGRAAQAYAAAAKYPYLLSQLFYWGGSDVTDDHKSLLDCFTTDYAADDPSVQDEAIEAVELFEDGKSISHIRQVIDKKYSKMYPFERDSDALSAYKAKRDSEFTEDSRTNELCHVYAARSSEVQAIMEQLLPKGSAQQKQDLLDEAFESADSMSRKGVSIDRGDSNAMRKASLVSTMVSRVTRVIEPYRDYVRARSELRYARDYLDFSNVDKPEPKIERSANGTGRPPELELQLKQMQNEYLKRISQHKLDWAQRDLDTARKKLVQMVGEEEVLKLDQSLEGS